MNTLDDLLESLRGLECISEALTSAGHLPDRFFVPEKRMQEIAKKLDARFQTGKQIARGMSLLSKGQKPSRPRERYRLVILGKPELLVTERGAERVVPVRLDEIKPRQPHPE